MNRVLLAIGGLLVGLLALLFAAPAMVDWNRYRGVFEEEASRFLGRDVRVGGRVNLRLLPVPFVQFEKVSVADTTASIGKPLFMADDFTVWLSVGSLLKGALEASEIELTRPVVTLVLDGRGGGSWSSLSPGTWQGSFVPSDVALSAVRITDGTLSILASDGRPKTSFAHVNGEMSAQALEGPYRIAAAFAHGERPMEIRLATAKPDGDGAVRFKGTVRNPTSGINYSLDGSARDVLKRLAVTGELTARLPLPAAMLAAPNSSREGSGDFDLRAQLKGDTSGFELADLALSFEQGGRPQLATGGARVTWLDQTDVTINLGSNWLDIDRIAGTDTGRSPLVLAETMLTSIASVLGTEGRTEANLKIEQATLGGDVVSDLEAAVEQTKDKLTVKRLAARLPGGARLATAGTFAPKGPAGEPKAQQASRYDGRVTLRGTNLTRFLGWAARDWPVAGSAREAAFAFTGDLSLGRAMLAARNVSLQIGRDTLNGEASWSREPQQALTVKLDGSELDLSAVMDSKAKPFDALKSLMQRFSGQPGEQGAEKTATSDVKLRLDRLVAGSLILRDVETEMRLADGNLVLPRLRFSSDDGYSLDVQGDIAAFARRDAKGTLTGIVAADKPSAVASLAQLAGLPDDLVPASATAEMLAPLRLAGRLDIGGKGPDTRQIKLDGILAGSRLAGSLRLGADEGNWRTRPTDLALSLDGPDLSRFVQRLLQTRVADTGREVGPTPVAPSNLRLRAIGSAKNGLESLASIEAPGARSEFHGRMTLEDTSEVALNGDVDVAFDDLARGLAMAGVSRRPGLAGTVAGKLHVERAGTRLKVTTDRLAIAGTLAEGAVTIEPSAPGHRLTGEVKLETASFASALAILSNGATRAGAGQAGAGTSPASTFPASPWAEAALDLAPLEGLAGSRLRLDIGALTLANEVAVKNAHVELAVRPNGVDLRLLESKALDGSASGVINLDKAATGAHLMLEARLAGARLEALSGRQTAEGRKPAASGGLSVVVKAQSTALSARGLVVGLNGGGELATERARLEQWTPGAIGVAAEAILGLKGEVPPGALATQLELALRSGGVAVGAQKLAIRVADGALAVAPLTVDTPRGQLAGKAVVDLDRLQFDGEWRISPRNTPQPTGLQAKPELPGIAAIYTGPVAHLGRLVPRLDIDALEREVAVRKVEREVAELERLRQMDKERAQQEANRIAQDKLDAERRLAEKLRLESLPQALGGTANPGAAPAGTAPQSPPPPAATTPAQTPRINPSAAPPNAAMSGPDAQQAAAPLAPAGGVAPIPEPSALPPETVQRAPLPVPRPASGSGSSATPAKAKRLDPFRKMIEANP